MDCRELFPIQNKSMPRFLKAIFIHLAANQCGDRGKVGCFWVKEVRNFKNFRQADSFEVLIDPPVKTGGEKKDRRENTFLFCKLILTIVSFVTSLDFPHSFSDPKRLDFLVTCRKCVVTSKQGHGWLSRVSGAAITSMFRVAAGLRGQERGEVCFIINSVLCDLRHCSLKCHAL